MDYYLLCGLGNIGNSYKLNRHNVGFLAIEYLLNKFFKDGLITNNTWKSKFNGAFKECLINDKKILFFKSMSYMNLSGERILRVFNFFNIKTHNLYIFHDDLDINFGKIRLKLGGSSGGHKGIDNIDYHINDRNYWRIRIGIGRPLYKNMINSYVLSNFNSEEIQSLERIFIFISNELSDFIKYNKEIKF